MSDLVAGAEFLEQLLRLWDIAGGSEAFRRRPELAGELRASLVNRIGSPGLPQFGGHSYLRRYSWARASQSRLMRAATALHVVAQSGDAGETAEARQAVAAQLVRHMKVAYVPRLDALQLLKLIVDGHLPVPATAVDSVKAAAAAAAFRELEDDVNELSTEEFQTLGRFADEHPQEVPDGAGAMIDSVVDDYLEYQLDNLTDHGGPEEQMAALEEIATVAREFGRDVEGRVERAQSDLAFDWEQEGEERPVHRGQSGPHVPDPVSDTELDQIFGELMSSREVDGSGMGDSGDGE